MNYETKPIVNSKNFIILDKYTKIDQSGADYQTEAELEKELIRDLQSQGYEFAKGIRNQKSMLENVRVQIQKLNDIVFSNDEWKRFVSEFLDKPSDSILDKTRKIQDNHVYDFTFNDGHIKNIYLVDKKLLSRNKVQVINQFEQTGEHINRYDVTILVNGLPLVQIELKKRGVAIREAFNQIHRYSKESFNTKHSLFKYLQVFIISNGTDSKYFANTTKREKSSFDFTMNWAESNNERIKDLKDFTATFLQKETLLSVVLRYCVFDITDTLLVMRPYQIAAAERIRWKIESSHHSKNCSTIESGGFIWHTTGSGKTLTSFKAARMATELDFIDKVFFVVDRKDLDFQTMKEYQRFSPNSVNGSESTAGLKRNIEEKDHKIIVTTIQKLNNLMKKDEVLDIYSKKVVFIFDEAHRSQFGEAQKNLKKKFKKFCQFGFTGTPIFAGKNALGSEDTASVFGRELHSYVITDAIRDEKVLKFKVDYNNVTPQFKKMETEQDLKKISALEHKEALLHPERIKEISQYILDNFNRKTHRNKSNSPGFNAMFAVGNIDSAKAYYDSLNSLQADRKKPLKIATIFSYTANEEQSAIGEILDEGFEVNSMNSSSKEFLNKVLRDYNSMFGTNYGVESKSFQNYYRDLAKRVKSGDVDLIIVVGMFLTGFDAPKLNTLFVDKNLRYHGLIQAFSRTNRIYGTDKTFGNIITFRDLEAATIKAITTFGNDNTQNVVLEKSYKEYMEGFGDTITGNARRGFIEVTTELREKFPIPDNIIKESDKKAFSKLFGEYLRAENILQNYDEFAGLQSFGELDIEDIEAVEIFKEKYSVKDEDIELMKTIKMPTPREVQDYRSTYNDIREWQRRERKGGEEGESNIDWDDVVFEVDLLKSQEINLDYILGLILAHNTSIKNKTELIEEVRRLIRANFSLREKEVLIIDFINKTDLDTITSKPDIIANFYKFAQGELLNEIGVLIDEENLNEDATKRYIKLSLKRKYASENGTDLNALMPKMSPLNPRQKETKKRVFEKISEFIEKFKGIGGDF